MLLFPFVRNIHNVQYAHLAVKCCNLLTVLSLVNDYVGSGVIKKII